MSISIFLNCLLKWKGKKNSHPWLSAYQKLLLLSNSTVLYEEIACKWQNHCWQLSYTELQTIMMPIYEWECKRKICDLRSRNRVERDCSSLKEHKVISQLQRKMLFSLLGSFANGEEGISGRWENPFCSVVPLLRASLEEKNLLATAMWQQWFYLSKWWCWYTFCSELRPLLQSSSHSVALLFSEHFISSFQPRLWNRYRLITGIIDGLSLVRVTPLGKINPFPEPTS